MSVCDKLSSVGKLVYDNGESYEGEWNRGKRHGKGIYVYLNGNVCAMSGMRSEAPND